MNIDTNAKCDGSVRTFSTGATRDTDNGKLDYEAFLSPLVLKRYAEYMHAHRKQSDGTLRDGDNWQKGIPIVQYMKSRWRHFIDTWTLHRQGKDMDPQQEVNLCAELFNVSGQLHEILKKKQADALDKALMDGFTRAEKRAAVQNLVGAQPPYDAEELRKTGLDCASNRARDRFVQHAPYAGAPAGTYELREPRAIRKGEFFLSNTGESVMLMDYTPKYARVRRPAVLCSVSTK